MYKYERQGVVAIHPSIHPHNIKPRPTWKLWRLVISRNRSGRVHARCGQATSYIDLGQHNGSERPLLVFFVFLLQPKMSEFSQPFVGLLQTAPAEYDATLVQKKTTRPAFLWAYAV